jgi:hypothetical protein
LSSDAAAATAATSVAHPKCLRGHPWNGSTTYQSANIAGSLPIPLEEAVKEPNPHRRDVIDHDDNVINVMMRRADAAC